MIRFEKIVVVVLVVGLMASCGFRRKKYENPITKDTQQPDKVLFDKAVQDIEKGRYEVARITLNTLINTYDTSEFLAKAKLAIADSWFREGGSHGMAQAEAEYKDFILFYPTLEEAAESQEKICMIHFRQMEKPDRDMTHAQRAEDECRQLLIQFPNSKFAPTAQQRLREIQEVIAEGEFRVGTFYHTKGSHPAAANRLQALVDHFPLYSQADQALWQLGDSYSKLGPRFRSKAGDAYTRIVRDYPLSPLTEEAKNRLGQLEMPIPEADPVALARMKYEQENYTKPGMMSPLWGVMKKSPNVNNAAKSGNPTMTAFRPLIPVSIPAANAGEGAAGTTDVTVSTVDGANSALDTQPDARQNQPAAKPTATPSEATSGANASTTSTPKDEKKNGKQKKEKKQKS